MVRAVVTWGAAVVLAAVAMLAVLAALARGDIGFFLRSDSRVSLRDTPSLLVMFLCLFFFIGTTLRTWRPLPADASPEEGRSIFAKDNALPQARVDTGLALTSVLSAIGLASLAQDIVQWRDFFSDFLENVWLVARTVLNWLPFHVPDQLVPVVIAYTGMLSLGLRAGVVMWRRGVISASAVTAFLGSAAIVMGISFYQR
jgi:hypothetical protein